MEATKHTEIGDEQAAVQNPETVNTWGDLGCLPSIVLSLALAPDQIQPVKEYVKLVDSQNLRLSPVVKNGRLSLFARRPSTDRAEAEAGSVLVRGSFINAESIATVCCIDEALENACLHMRSLYREYHSTTCHVTNQLSVMSGILSALNNKVAAEALLIASLSLVERIESDETVNALMDVYLRELADFYYSEGIYTEALAHYTRYLELRKHWYTDQGEVEYEVAERIQVCKEQVQS